MCVYVCICMYMYVYIYIYIYTYAHSYMYYMYAPLDQVLALSADRVELLSEGPVGPLDLLNDLYYISLCLNVYIYM